MIPLMGVAEQPEAIPVPDFTNQSADARGFEEGAVARREAPETSGEAKEGSSYAGDNDTRPAPSSVELMMRDPAENQVPGGSPSAAAGQFANVEWRPVNRYGLAEVVISSSLKQKISRVELLSADGGGVLGTAGDAGIDRAGNFVWRFKRDGASYPPGSVVRFTLSDGGVRLTTI